MSSRGVRPAGKKLSFSSMIYVSVLAISSKGICFSCSMFSLSKTVGFRICLAVAAVIAY